MDRVLRGALALTFVLLVVATTALVTTRRDVSQLSERVDELSAELEDTQEELAEVEEAPPDGALTGLDGLAGLFGELLGGEGGDALGGLLGGSGSDLAACAIGGDGLGGLGSADPIAGGSASEQIAEITERVEDLRELDGSEELNVSFLSTADISQRVTELVLEDYPAEEAELDSRLLAALGAVPDDLDLRAAQAELVSGQVAGFYDPDTGGLVVRGDDPDQPLGPAEQVTLAHEVEHALADQVLGLDVEEEGRSTDAERAALAVVEGDATLTMQRFTAGALDLTQQLALATDPAVVGSQAQLEDFPHALTAPLLFSYSEGLGFVCDRHADGGWDAVDAAYADRPETTAEILFPDRYPLAPVEPRPPTQPGGGWSQARTDTFGAADLLWLFEAPGDQEAAALDDPRGRAGDWAGGHYALYTDGAATAIGIALVGGAGEGAPLCDSLTAWYDAAFSNAADAPAADAALARTGPEQSAVIVCTRDEVRLGIAPHLATAQTLAD